MNEETSQHEADGFLAWVMSLTITNVPIDPHKTWAATQSTTIVPALGGNCITCTKYDVQNNAMGLGLKNWGKNASKDLKTMQTSKQKLSKATKQSVWAKNCHRNKTVYSLTYYIEERVAKVNGIKLSVRLGFLSVKWQQGCKGVVVKFFLWSSKHPACMINTVNNYLKTTQSFHPIFIFPAAASHEISSQNTVS